MCGQADSHVLKMIDPSLRLVSYSYGKRSATPVETFKNVLGSSQKFQFLIARGGVPLPPFWRGGLSGGGVQVFTAFQGAFHEGSIMA